MTKVSKSPSFGNLNFFSVTETVQSNTLLNRGIVEVGGISIPHALMSNNKDEAIERIQSSILYLTSSFLTPFSCFLFSISVH